MRSNGLATILLLIPVLTIPALAIFGIPQFGAVQDNLDIDLFESTTESRSGRTVKQTHENAFSDFEGFGADSETPDEPPVKRQNSAGLQRISKNSGTRAKSDTAVADLDDNSALARLNQQESRPAPSSLENRESDEAFSAAPEPKKTVIIERSSRRSKRLKQSGSSDASAQSPSANGALDKDQNVLQAGFEEVVEEEQPKSTSKRPRSNEPRVAKSREATEGQLTWKTAVERLHELDIRNFRIEQGRDSDQFVVICYATGDTPHTSIRFEAEANEPLKALEKVLEQIVERQQRRQ